MLCHLLAMISKLFDSHFVEENNNCVRTPLPGSNYSAIQTLTTSEHTQNTSIGEAVQPVPAIQESCVLERRREDARVQEPGLPELASAPGIAAPCPISLPCLLTALDIGRIQDKQLAEL